MNQNSQKIAAVRTHTNGIEFVAAVGFSLVENNTNDEDGDTDNDNEEASLTPDHVLELYLPTNLEKFNAKNCVVISR